ncbi:MAG: ATP-binding protein [Thaumarchaeota archaeon]|nr:ATP-binding protein [Nitrososphaerota archaeon]
MKQKPEFFKISTGLKDIIGKELITEAHTAVFELVKNAYDANATRVDVVFQGIKHDDVARRGKVMIVDDGDGMSSSDIRNKWLFVGYSEKKERDGTRKDFRRRTTRKNRVMAGSKGVGRFSADRLGGMLDMYTKTRSDRHVHRVRMDWGRFKDNQNEEFQTVEVAHDTLDEFPDTGSHRLTHGTILEIYPLEDKWDGERLLKLKKYLQRLVNPMQMSDAGEFEINLIADEFLESDKKLKKAGKEHEAINGKVTNVVFEKLGIKTTQIICTVSQSKITTEITDKGRFVFKTEEANEHQKHLRDISISVFYLNPEAKKTFTRAMGMEPVKFGSIFLYKNGFRIHPYGEEKDDWLTLEQRKGQGHSRYLATRELIGRVEINRNQDGFKEVSSRHGGVVETEEYRQLVRFMINRVIRWLERYVVEGLDWDRAAAGDKTHDEVEVLAKFTNQIKDPNKRVTFNPDIMSIVEERRIRDLPEVMKNLRTMVPFAESAVQKTFERELRRVESIAKAHKAGETAATKALKAKDKEILFLKKRVPDDAKRAGDYAHWIRIATGSITNHLMDLTKAIREGGDAESLMSIAESISWENERIRMVAAYIGKANFDVRKTEMRADIVAYVVQYVDNVASNNAKRIMMTCLNRNVEFKTTFMPAAVFMMIDNFISNSRKEGARKLSFKFSIKGRMLHMLVSDDGRGVPDEVKESIFQRGFSTSKAGSGIGLNHVRTMARNMGGNVKFLGNNLPGRYSGACFEVTINAS